MTAARAAIALRSWLGGLWMIASLGCGSTGPSAHEVDFEVAVAAESFVLRVRDPETIGLAREAQRGTRHLFPIGPLRRGNGGFNAPWSWHFDPAEVRMTEAAIEGCDGRPSYVEGHLAEYPTYCPWGARVVRER